MLDFARTDGEPSSSQSKAKRSHGLDGNAALNDHTVELLRSSSLTLLRSCYIGHR
jgi:hypothetical protein